MTISEIRISHDLEDIIIESFDSAYPTPRYTIPDGGEFEYDEYTGYYSLPVFDTQKEELFWAACDPDVDGEGTYWWSIADVPCPYWRIDVYADGDFIDSTTTRGSMDDHRYDHRDPFDVVRAVMEEYPDCEVTVSEIAETETDSYHVYKDLTLYTTTAEEFLARVPSDNA